MQITFEQIIDIVENGLSEAEINSFKHGNTPTEFSRVKGVVQNLFPLFSYNTTTRHEALKGLHELIGRANDIETLELEASIIRGIY